VLPTYQAILPTSQTASQSYKYVFAPPAPKWSDMNFDDSAWMSGPGGFGTGAPGAGLLGTVWNTPDVWLRRNFTLPKLSSEALNKVLLADFHDDDFEVYLNGVLAYRKTGYIFRDYEYSLLSDAAKAALVVGGDNMMAVHCHQLTYVFNKGGAINGIFDLQIAPAQNLIGPSFQGESTDRVIQWTYWNARYEVPVNPVGDHDIGQIQQDSVHSANFGAKLQEKCQLLGVACELVYPGAPGIEANPYHKIHFEKYFIGKLLGSK
jgi:hypothetical protein